MACPVSNTKLVCIQKPPSRRRRVAGPLVQTGAFGFVQTANVVCAQAATGRSAQSSKWAKKGSSSYPYFGPWRLLRAVLFAAHPPSVIGVTPRSHSRTAGKRAKSAYFCPPRPVASSSGAGRFVCSYGSFAFSVYALHCAGADEIKSIMTELQRG